MRILIANLNSQDLLIYLYVRRTDQGIQNGLSMPSDGAIYLGHEEIIFNFNT